MMLIGLLRHGEAEGGSRFRGHTDDSLTGIGVAQMQAAANSGHRWDRVISSPLVRCAEFAKAYARRHSLSLTLDDRLKEMHFGAWEGRTAAEIMADAPDALTQFWSAPDKCPPPDGEPLAQFQARVLDAWNDIVVGHVRQRVLVVTHGGVIRVLLCHVLEAPLAKLQEFEVKHGGLYRVRVDVGGKAMLISDSIMGV